MIETVGDCSGCVDAMNPQTTPFRVDEIKRYSRQLFLPEVGYSGQLALKNATVTVIGLGGLGSPCALYLNASGIGRLILVDGDRLERSNLQRQVIHRTQNIGMLKTQSASALLRECNPHTILETVTDSLSEENAEKIIHTADIVVDCSDNFNTRYLVNSMCIRHKKPLVSASVIAFSGQLCCFDFRDQFRDQSTACYACLFAPDNGHEHQNENCSEVGVFATAAGILGLMQANETIKMLIGLATLKNRLLLLDVLTLQQRIIEITVDPKCRCQAQQSQCGE